MNSKNPEMLDAAQTLAVALHALDCALNEDEAVEQDAVDICKRLDRLAEQGIPVQALLCIAAKRELAKTVCLKNVPYAWRLLQWPEEHYVIYNEDDLMEGINKILRNDPAVPRAVHIHHMEPHPAGQVQYYEHLSESAQKYMQRPKTGPKKNEFMWFDRLCVFDSAADAWKLRRATSLLQGSHKTPMQSLQAASAKEAQVGVPSNMRFTKLDDVRTCHCLYERLATATVTITNLRFAIADEMIPSSFVLSSLAAVCQQFEALVSRPDKWLFQVHADAAKCGIPSLATSTAVQQPAPAPAPAAAAAAQPPQQTAAVPPPTQSVPPAQQQKPPTAAAAASASSWASAALSETPPREEQPPRTVSHAASALQQQDEHQGLGVAGFEDSHQDFGGGLGLDALNEAAAMPIGIDDQLRGMIGVSAPADSMALPGAAKLWAAPGNTPPGAWPASASAQPPASQGLGLPVSVSQGLGLPVSTPQSTPASMSGSSTPLMTNTPPRKQQPAAMGGRGQLSGATWLASRQHLAHVAAQAFRELSNGASGMSAAVSLGTVSMHKYSTAADAGWPEALTVTFVSDLQGLQHQFSIQCSSGASVQCSELQAALQQWSDGGLDFTVGRVLEARESRAALADTGVEHLRLVCTPRHPSAEYAQRVSQRLKQLAQVTASAPGVAAGVMLPEAVNRDTGAMCFKLSAGTLAQRMEVAHAASAASAGNAGEFAVGELEEIVRQATQILAAVHGAGTGDVSHGDLHEGQVYIMPSGRVCLGGWFSPAVLSGTPGALRRVPPPSVPATAGSPHTLQNDDVWQLGALVYAAATAGGSIWGVFRSAWGLFADEGEHAARSSVVAAWQASPWRRSRVSQADMPNVPRRCLASLIALMTDLQGSARPSCELLLRHPGLLQDDVYCIFLQVAERMRQQCNAQNEDDPWRIIARQIGQQYPAGYQQWMAFVNPMDANQLRGALRQEYSFVHHRTLAQSEVPGAGCSNTELAKALVDALSYSARAGNVQQLLEQGTGGCEWLRRSRTCGWLAGAIAEGHLQHAVHLQAVVKKAQAAATAFEQLLP